MWDSERFATPSPAKWEARGKKEQCRPNPFLEQVRHWCWNQEDHWYLWNLDLCRQLPITPMEEFMSTGGAPFFLAFRIWIRSSKQRQPDLVWNILESWMGCDLIYSSDFYGLARIVTPV